MTRSVLITGATSGLGLAASTELAGSGYHVIMGCRDPRRAEVAAARIRATAPDASLETLTIDLASLASVRAAVAELTTPTDRPPLHAVICNAGIQIVDGIKSSAEGYELTFATNHLGHFLLTRLLLDHLAEPGRIVLVSSGTHFGPSRSLGFPGPRWRDPRELADPATTGLGRSARAGRIRYSTSKLANLYTTYELARRTAGHGITVNAFDPGLMPETRLDRDYPTRVQRLYERITPLLVRGVPGVRTVAESGSTLAWLATAPELADVTGAYFAGRRRRLSSRESRDESRAAELWQVSEELVATRP